MFNSAAVDLLTHIRETTTRTVMLFLPLPVAVLAQDITISSTSHASVTIGFGPNHTSVGIGGAVTVFELHPGRDRFPLMRAYFSASTVGGQPFKLATGVRCPCGG
jgi:hypothetical protein